jgi:hypothetical protein
MSDWYVTDDKLFVADPTGEMEERCNVSTWTRAEIEAAVEFIIRDDEQRARGEQHLAMFL